MQKNILMENKKILNVAFPRSGHHLLEQCLRLYFRDQFHYCHFDHHCKQIPCTDPKTNFQKHHDYKLFLVNNPSTNYIIQYRHPIESLISLYNLSKQLGKITENDTKKDWFTFLNTLDSMPKVFYRYYHRQYFYWRCGYMRLDFRRLFRFPNSSIPSRLLYWQIFVNKWVINNKNPNTYYLQYADFIDNPRNKLKEVIAFINPQKTVDTKLIDEIVDRMDISLRNDIRDFKFYDPYFFRKLEQEVSRELKILNIKSVVE